MNERLEHLAGDLRASGVPERDILRTIRLYDRALTDRSPSAWRRFYVATFCALRRSASQALPRSIAAVESLLRLFTDDFGAALFDRAAVAQLGARLCGELSASRREEAGAPA